MIYELKSKELTVKISDLGAELTSAKDNDGNEYVWQGDEKYWTGRCPILFPICGRLFGSHFTYGGKEYALTIHGFAKRALFTVCAAYQNSIQLSLFPNEEAKKLYPFDFRLDISYTLNGRELKSEILITNTGKDTLPATFGAHPGFNVPVGGNGKFEDCYLEFGDDCTPDRLIFSDTCFNTGFKKPLRLENSKILRLEHSLFDNDAIFMSRMADSIMLKSEKSKKFVRMEYSDMPYLGIWHKPKSDAPYVCIEPWCGLPSFDGIVDDLSTKSDMFRLEPSASKALGYKIIFG